MKRTVLSILLPIALLIALALSISAPAQAGNTGCYAHRPKYIEGVFEVRYDSNCTGHDEPELDPVSSAPGSARDLTWTVILPSGGVPEGLVTHKAKGTQVPVALPICRADLEFVDGMNLPERNAPRIRTNLSALRAGNVAGIEEKLAGYAHHQVLRGDLIAICEHPATGCLACPTKGGVFFAASHTSVVLCAKFLPPALEEPQL